jgi:hypothetical protein
VPAHHPGETITLHWLVNGAPAPSPPAVTLRAALAGPYATVAALKADKQPTYTIAAPAVHPSGLAGDAPTSVLTIPAAARPGYYNLRLTSDGVGTSTSGASVVRVR